MSDSPHQSSLRLNQCVACRYNLRGSPPKGRCPECGFAYDASMFSLEQKPTATSTIQTFSGFLALSLVLWMAFVMYRSGNGTILEFLPLIGIVGAVAAWKFVKRGRRISAPIGGKLLLFDSRGVTEYLDDGPQPLIPWSDCASVSLKRRRSHWRLTFFHQRDRQIDPYKPHLRLAACAIWFNATFEEAHAIRLEVETRMKMSRQAARRRDQAALPTRP